MYCCSCSHCQSQFWQAASWLISLCCCCIAPCWLSFGLLLKAGLVLLQKCVPASGLSLDDGGSLTALIRFCWICADVISQGSLEKSAEKNKKYHFLLVYWLERERESKESSCFRNCSAFRTICASVDGMMDVLQLTCLKDTITNNSAWYLRWCIHIVVLKRLHTPRTCKMFIIFTKKEGSYKMRYFLFSSVLNTIFYIKDVYT